MRERYQEGHPNITDCFRKFLNIRTAFAVNGFSTATVSVIKITKS